MKRVKKEERNPTTYEIHPLYAERYSPRAFSDEGVSREAVASMLEAARWAPSCANEQPWVFFVARREESEDFEKLASLLDEGNSRWAKLAPVLVVGAARTQWARGGDNAYAAHDLGLATAQLIGQAVALGLQAHPMAGFYADRAREVLALPEDIAPLTMIAIGYAGDPSILPEDLEARERAPRSRRPMDEIAFGARFNAPYLKD